MSIVQIIVILGAACVSPTDTAPQTTTVYKVPCAIIINGAGGGTTEIAKDQARVQPVSAPAPAEKKKTVKRACKKKFYWKRGKKKWRCVR